MSLWRVSWRATEKLWFYSEKWFTLWWSNIAMENGLFSSMIYDELPTKIVWRLWFSTGTLNQELVILNGEIMQILRWTGDWVGVIGIQLMVHRGSNQMGIYKEFSSLVSSGIFCSSLFIHKDGDPRSSLCSLSRRYHKSSVKRWWRYLHLKCRYLSSIECQL